MRTGTCDSVAGTGNHSWSPQVVTMTGVEPEPELKRESGHARADGARFKLYLVIE